MNLYWQLPCSNKPFMHRLCMNSSAGILHRTSFPRWNPHLFTSKYIKPDLHENSSTSTQEQSGSHIHRTVFACEYRQLHKRLTLLCRYTPGCTYSDVNTFIHMPRSNTITAAHENTKKAALYSFYKATNSHIIELVLPN